MVDSGWGWHYFLLAQSIVDHKWMVVRAGYVGDDVDAAACSAQKPIEQAVPIQTLLSQLSSLLSLLQSYLGRLRYDGKAGQTAFV